MKTLNLPKKAIVFDMDGVLFDTELFYYERRKDFLESRGIAIDHLPPAYFIGGNMKQVWRDILGQDYERWDVSQLQQEYNAHKASHPLPYKDLLFADVPATLAQLMERGVVIGLASSSTLEDIELALEVTGLRRYFAFTLSGENFPDSKPDPAIYRAAVAALGLPEDDILVLEDSPKGIAAALGAGLDVLAVKDNRFGLDQSQAMGYINQVAEVVPLFG